MEFYNLKTKKKVEVPDSELKKRRSVRTTSGGTRQERYAVVADTDVDGKPLRMYKFVNKATVDSLDVPQLSYRPPGKRDFPRSHEPRATSERWRIEATLILPAMGPPRDVAELRLAELLAGLSLVTALAARHPAEQALRASVLTSHLAENMGLSDEEASH